MTIGKRIKQLRENLNMTQEDVAKKTDVAIQTIFKYEKEIVTNIPLDKIELLAKALNVTPSYLIGWEDNNNEPNHSPAFQNISPNEQQLLNKYNQLNDLGKEKANEYVDILIENEKYTKEDKKTVIDFNDKIRTVDSDNELKTAAYGGGVDSDDDTVKHT